jgi:cob(I)alamin adenosyltransferase
MSERAYYVIFEDDQWKVKLERGRVVSAGHRTQQAAINKARSLGRRNDRKVVINAKEGYTRRHIKNP